MQPRSLLLALTCVAWATQPRAQAWFLVNSTSPSFAGKLVRDTQGVICLDEQAGNTLLFAGGTWTIITPASAPTPRVLSAVTSSIAGATSVSAFVFGGFDITIGALLNDLWVFNRPGTTWQQLQPTGTPTGPGPRIAHACAPFGSGLLLFGGTTSATSLFGNDTWVALIIGGTPVWFQQTTPAGLVGRRFHSMAQGPGNTAVLFGGENAAGLLGDTWVFNPSTAAWTQVAGVGPDPRTAAGMTYDPDRDMVVLRGGVSAAGVLTDDWEFNGFAWRKVPAATQPSGNELAFDPTTGSSGVITIQNVVPNVTETLRFKASLAAFTSTLDIVCNAGLGDMMLTAVNRSLPISGQVLAMRVSNVTPSSVVFGAFELTPAAGPFSGPVLGCGVCVQGVTTGAATQLLAVTGSVANWNLPISSSPLLLGQTLELQGIVLDSSNPLVHPCFIMTTNRCTAVVGL